MPAIGQSYYDLIDHYKSVNPDGTIADVIEMLMQTNPILEDALAVECNDGTKHKTTMRTGLPEVAWGRLYKGTKQGKSTKRQVEDVTGFVEGLSAVDTRLLELSTNEASERLSEAMTFLEAISQEVASKLFYGSDVANAEEFMGLAPRYNDLSAENGRQIIDAGGTGNDNTSIWMVTWGLNQTHTLYPKGTKAGIKREDKGEQRVLDANGNPYWVKEEKFTQHMGLSLRDWRYTTRIANIDVSELQAGNVDLYGLLRQGYYRNEGRRHNKVKNNGQMGRMAIYCNSDVMEQLDALATNAGASDNFVRLRHTEVQGEEVLAYRKAPVRETDAIHNSEERVV